MSRWKKRAFPWIGVIVSMVMMLSFLGGCGGRPSTNMPKAAYEVIFEKSDFAEPITLSIPCEDNPGNMEALRAHRSGLPPAGAGSRFIHYPKGIVDILVKHGYMDIEKLTVHSRFYSGGSQTFEFPKYTDKIAPYIDKITIGSLFSPREIEFTEAGLRECRKSPYSNRHLRLASRVLKSIDFENIYTHPATAWSPEYEVVAVRFSYTLKKEFPHAEEIAEVQTWQTAFLEGVSFDKVYTGEAKAYLTPDFREWELEGITLEDAQLRF